MTSQVLKHLILEHQRLDKNLFVGILAAVGAIKSILNKTEVLDDRLAQKKIQWRGAAFRL